MTKQEMKRILSEYCDLKLQIKALDEQAAILNKLIKDNSELAQGVDGFRVIVSQVQSEGVSLPTLREEVPEKTFEKYIAPHVRSSSYERLVINRTATENIATVIPALQRRVR